MGIIRGGSTKDEVHFEISREMIRFILTVSGDEVEIREFIGSLMYHFYKDLDLNEKYRRNSPLFQELLSILGRSDDNPNPKTIKMMQVKNILLNHLSEKHRVILDQLIKEEKEDVRKEWENLKNLDLNLYSNIKEKL